METFTCNVAQQGFFAGSVCFVQPHHAKGGVRALGSEEELSRFRSAVDSLKGNIVAVGSSARSEDVRETVLSILGDETFTTKVEQRIKERQLDAVSAIQDAGDELGRAFDAMESEYLRSRGDDVRGVASELITILEGRATELQKPRAICADEISPAQLVDMDESLVGALLTEKGSANSHVSIMAGNLGVPYLYGNAQAVAAASSTSFVIVDSETATVTIDPDEPTRKAAEQRMEQLARERAERKASFAAQTGEEAVCCRTKVCANIAGSGDVDALLESGADGVGLFRTEFLFIGCDTPPSEEAQLQAYKTVLEAMGEKPVVIRTMDIGSDKRPPWLGLGDESNPALGLRGVRVSLEHDELFRVQLRALLRAAATGNLKVMFPMIASAWEVDEALGRVQAAAQELESEGAAFKVPELGIMVETPAAAVCAGEFAEKVDFFSIGTNDLTQYTLAVDREGRGLDRYFDAHHEAVLKLVEMTVAGGHEHGVETGMCGQLAADPAAIDRLVAMGIDELSVPVAKVQAVKALVAKAEARQASVGEEKATGGASAAVGASAAGHAAVAADHAASAVGCTAGATGGAVATDHAAGASPRSETSFDLELAAAADGELVAMSDIPDAAFSSGSLGYCFGIMPEGGNVYAPIAGVVTSVAATKHALAITADNGRSVLVHVGIDTVKLGGKPFTLHVEQGDRVERDQLIMEADVDAIKREGLSPLIIVALLRE